MKKFMLLVSTVVLLFATSCLDGKNTGGSSSAEYYGTLTVTDTESGEVTYFDEESQVIVTIPNSYEAKFDIVFKGVKFDKGMPALNVKVEGVPFTNTISEDETTINYIFTAENIIPSVGGISYNKYKIDKLEGCIGRNIDINFTMASKGKSVNFTNRTESTASEE
jgi:hypothetical protein